MGAYRADDDGSFGGELELVLNSSGAPSPQRLVSGNAVSDGAFDAPRNSLYGISEFNPVTYFRQDLSAGESESFETEIESGGSSEFTASDDYILFKSGGYEVTEPAELFRIDKETGETLVLDTGLPFRFELRAADASLVYLEVPNHPDLEDIAPPGLYYLPLDGSAPAVRSGVDARGIWTLHPTLGGTFVQFYNAYDRSRENVYRVGPGAADAAQHPLVASLSRACEWSSITFRDETLFALVSSEGYYWLLELPLS